LERRTVGVVVNPVAGMGGPVGLKGTDGATTLAEARARGAVATAPERARRALARLAAEAPDVAVLVAPGVLGAEAATAAGLHPVPIGPVPSGEATTAADTRAAAAAFAARDVDLILFAGGDGTARDVLDTVGGRVPVLGIPTGVKMHSAVFARSPEAAGNLAGLYLGRGRAQVRLREAEVMDIDEDAVRAGRVSARLHGYVRTPYERSLVQNAKAGPRVSDEEAAAAIAAAFARETEPGTLYLLGPGTTCRRVAEALGLEGTLLGVDAVRDGRLVGRDLTRGQIAALLADGGPARIVVSVTGGQGFLFGRGNQQFGPEILRRVGRENVVVLTTMEKLLSLAEPRLFVDTGDPETDRALAGWIRVRTGPDRSTMMKVAA
jgi:predicted polyphosphate/ATP-dependent NAD kinase